MRMESAEELLRFDGRGEFPNSDKIIFPNEPDGHRMVNRNQHPLQIISWLFKQIAFDKVADWNVNI